MVLRIRRFLCTGCGAVMLAVPGSCAPSKHFSGGAIGLALALWSAGRTAAQVREEVSDWKVLGVAARGWRSLSRWAGEVKTGKLFAWLSLGEQTGSARVVAGRAAQALRGYAPVEWRESPAWIQSQIGASHVS